MIANDEVKHVCPISGCDEALVEGPNAEQNWCPLHLKSFSDDEIEGRSKWRAMSWSERVRRVTELGPKAIALLGISEGDYNDTLQFAARQRADILFSGDVAPDKIALLNLAKGLSDTGALQELVDNALDCSQRKRGGERITVNIELNADQGFVRVSDDAGGMTKDQLLRCLRLGSHTPEGHVDNVIGRFGVGAKEAIYRFGREITIRSSDISNPIGMELFVPEEWLEHKDWNVNVRSADVVPGTSSIRIDVLDHVNFDRKRIGSELWNTYEKRIRSGRLNIVIDGEPLEQMEPPPELLFPPELYPRKYSFYVENVAVSVDVALLEDAPSESGIFFYAFGRRYAHWSWVNPLASTVVSKVPQSHLNTHIRVDVDFQGRIDDIPINSNKDEVVTSAPIFRNLAKTIGRIVQPYLGTVSWLSRDNNMSYLQKRYAGRPNAHSSVTAEALGLEVAIDLGRVYPSMQLGKPRIADQLSMQEIIGAERSPIAATTATSLAGTREIAQPRSDAKLSAPTLKPADQEPRNASSSRETGSSHTTPATAPATVITVSLLSEDPRKIEILRAEIRNAAIALGIQAKVD